MNPNKIFPQRLRETMKENNMRKTDLVNATGINKSAISSYLFGRYEPKPDRLWKIAVALKVNPLWLLGVSGKKRGENDGVCKQSL